MNAPSIPNLLSLRGGRGGRGRGRGRGGHPGSSSGPAANDATIQGTDTDAAVSRLSAVELGYLEDPFAQYFVSPAARTTRRLPIINRGTYMRTSIIDELVDQFRENADGNAQIVSLGAGTDTRALRLFSGYFGLFSRSRHGASGLVYHEVDFSVVCDQKLATVSTTPALRQALPNPDRIEEERGSWKSCQPRFSNEYRCHGIDIRKLALDRDTGDSPELAGLRLDLPTLLISECCLCYLEKPEASNIIKYFKDRIKDLYIIIYEPVKPDDPFGKQMVSNLAQRGIRMPTLEVYKEPQDQVRRLDDAGFGIAGAQTVDEIWDDVKNEEKERVDSLEGLDEVEEWKLLAGHYVIAWASQKGGMGLRYDKDWGPH